MSGRLHPRPKLATKASQAKARRLTVAGLGPGRFDDGATIAAILFIEHCDLKIGTVTYLRADSDRKRRTFRDILGSRFQGRLESRRARGQVTWAGASASA